MTYSRNGKMERCRENRRKKTLNRKHGYCYLKGGVGVTTGVSHLSYTHITVYVCVCIQTQPELHTLLALYVCVCVSVDVHIHYENCRVTLCRKTHLHGIIVLNPTTENLHSACFKCTSPSGCL